MTDKPFDHDPMIMSGQVKQKLTEDPELAAAMKDVFALMRQAHAAWQAGQYPSMDVALRALGLDVEEVPEGDPDLEGIDLDDLLA